MDHDENMAVDTEEFKSEMLTRYPAKVAKKKKKANCH